MEESSSKSSEINIKRLSCNIETENSLCAICSSNIPRYKCPVCITKFCSATCYKTHKASGTCVSTPVSQKPKLDSSGSEGCVVASYEYKTEDTVPVERLKYLEKDKAILKALQNPHLRAMMTYLDSSKSPSNDIANAMREPIFVEFATRCLHVVNKDRTQDSDDSSDDSSED